MEPPDRITVKLKNDAVHTIEVTERATLKTKSEIYAKYMSCATMTLSELIDQLENMPDIAVLMTCMNGDELTVD